MRKIFCDHCGSEILNLKNPDSKKPVKEIEVKYDSGKLMCKIINCTTDDICETCFVKNILKTISYTPKEKLFELPNNPSLVETQQACLNFDHSFGLMEINETIAMQNQALSWLESWNKVLKKQETFS